MVLPWPKWSQTDLLQERKQLLWCRGPRDVLCEREGGLESYLNFQVCKNHKSWCYHLIFKEAPFPLGWQ